MVGTNHWAQQFLDLVKTAGKPAGSINYANGWLETATINGQKCFMKSITFNRERRLYFQGVDPSKLSETGDFVILCGGSENHLRDIFVIPWTAFFTAMGNSEPVKTYKDRDYLQYKFSVVQRGKGWEIQFQRTTGPNLVVTTWRYSPNAAVAIF